MATKAKKVPFYEEIGVNKKPLLQRVEEANEVAGCKVTTLGTVWAIARGSLDPKPYLLDYSVSDLCTALALRGYDVKAVQPSAKEIARRCAKAREQARHAR